ncbi:MAG: dihydroorotase [Candidatus Omnitrophica bacterium]|nr:dihydroorotase [Candidatus Omnitrophota bacterium]
MRLLVKNGTVIDPANKIEAVMDILAQDGRISRVAKDIKIEADTVIDAAGMIVMPSVVDMHVHLREPGREDKETVASGTMAAARGGVTTVLAMPNTSPAIDSGENVQALKDIINRSALIDVLISGAITMGRLGKELCDIGAMRKKGAIVITDDGASVEDEELMLKALSAAKKDKILVVCHCEDKRLSGKGVVNFGFTSTRLGLRGVPNESEYKRVERDIRLAAETGASIHIAHLSCAESVDIIRKAKKDGVKVTAETAPHYFTLNEDAVLDYNTNMKINPPLRSCKDVEAIKRGLKDGVIDAIASDHAPHTENEKEIEFEYAESGTIGLETELSAGITALVDKGLLTWNELVEKMCLNPARILGIDKGSLGVGREADITIVSPGKEWTVKKHNFMSRSSNSAFLGMKLKGVVEYTIYKGRVIYSARKGVAE